MTDHLTDDEILGFVRRLGSASDRSRAALHLSGCAHCRTRASSSSEGTRAADRILGSVSRAAKHLDYETLEALVDRRLPTARRAAAEDHLASCPQCRREHEDLLAAATMLATPVAASSRPVASGEAGSRVGPNPAAPAPDPPVSPARRGPIPRAQPTEASWANRWRERIAALVSVGSSGGFGPRAAFALVVVAVGAALVLRQTVPDGGSTDVDSRPGTATDARLSGAPNAYDRSALTAFAATSPQANRALVERDYAALGQLIERSAEGGDVLALSALGLLHAEGLGRPMDPGAAQAAWRRAAALGDRQAAVNLDVLRRAYPGLMRQP